MASFQTLIAAHEEARRLAVAGATDGLATRVVGLTCALADEQAAHAETRAKLVEALAQVAAAGVAAAEEAEKAKADAAAQAADPAKARAAMEAVHPADPGKAGEDLAAAVAAAGPKGPNAPPRTRPQ